MGQPALDRMIAIADVFDRGTFAGMGKVDTDSVAAAVGLPSTSVSRLLRALEFKCFSERRSVPVRKDRVYEYPPRIRLPDLKRVRNPGTRLIVEAIADHRLPRKFDTDLLYIRLGNDLSQYTIGRLGHLPHRLHNSLKELGFSTHRPPGFKPKPAVRPATWRQPVLWNPLFVEQRRLRRNGLTVSAVLRMTDAAAKLGGVVNIALEQLDFSRIPYDRRGALKAAIREVLTNAFDEWLRQQRRDKSQAIQEVDWTAVARLSDDHLRDFASIAGRVAASKSNDNPGAYALRWVKETLPGAGTDVALEVNA